MVSQELPWAARAAWRDGSRIQGQGASIGLPIAILILLALSVFRTYSTPQNFSMYDNPIYRWRESLAIALSRMQAKPLHGYVAYRSISDYLNKHGLAMFNGEADVFPTEKELSDLTHDRSRMEQLIQAASRVRIDEGLPPVILHGNEKGLADYYYFAFELFGLNINALVLFYYMLLAASLAMFFATFRKSSFCMLLLSLYLIGHYYMLGYTIIPHLQAIHNSRILPSTRDTADHALTSTGAAARAANTRECRRGGWASCSSVFSHFLPLPGDLAGGGNHRQSHHRTPVYRLCRTVGSDATTARGRPIGETADHGHMAGGSDHSRPCRLCSLFSLCDRPCLSRRNNDAYVLGSAFGRVDQRQSAAATPLRKREPPLR